MFAILFKYFKFKCVLFSPFVTDVFFLTLPTLGHIIHKDKYKCLNLGFIIESGSSFQMNYFIPKGILKWFQILFGPASVIGVPACLPHKGCAEEEGPVSVLIILPVQSNQNQNSLFRLN